MGAATIRDIADDVGVSVATVSRALNGNDRVGAATAKRVRQSAEAFGYVPNEIARNLAGGRTSSLAVIVPDITNPFFPELVAGVQAVADEHRHMLYLAQDHDSTDATADLITNLRSRQVSGFVVVGGDSRSKQKKLLEGVPHTVVDRTLKDTEATVVRSDNRRGGRIAAEHLVSLGHERILLIGGPSELANSADRRAGIHDALAAADLPILPELEVTGDFLEESGYRNVMALRGRRLSFTAVIAANDLMAIGALRALDETGIRVPQDVSVVGYDDIHLAGYVSPGLTTVRQEIAAMGRHAALLLLDPHRAARNNASLNSGDHVLDVKLVRRGTTAPRHTATQEVSS